MRKKTPTHGGSCEPATQDARARLSYRGLHNETLFVGFNDDPEFEASLDFLLWNCPRLRGADMKKWAEGAA